MGTSRKDPPLPERREYDVRFTTELQALGDDIDTLTLGHESRHKVPCPAQCALVRVGGRLVGFTIYDQAQLALIRAKFHFTIR